MKNAPISLNSIKYPLVILLLLSTKAWASNYPDPVASFLFMVFYGIGISAVVYLVLGIIIALFGSLKSFFMIPVFFVLLGFGFFTVAETVLTSLVGTYPGGLLVGALISTAIFVFMVKKTPASTRTHN